MALYPIPQTYSIRDLQRRHRAIFSTLKRSRGAALLMRHQTPEAVLIDIESYNALVRDDYAYDEPRVAKLIAAARRSARVGKTKVLRSWNDLDASR